MKNNLQTNRGFTLIELLIVIAIIAALAVTVFVALNPLKRLQDARDSRRTSDVEGILTAIHESIVDNKGSLPTNMPIAGGSEVQLGNGSSGCAITNAVSGCAVTATICADLNTGATNLTKYLKSMPIDPTSTFTASKSGYSVQIDTNNIITIRACGVEGTTAITQSR